MPRSSRQSDHTRPNHRKEAKNEVVWTCLPFIRSVQNQLARHSERGKKTRQKKRWEDKPSNGQAWSSPNPRGRGWESRKNGANWLWSQLWYPKRPPWLMKVKEVSIYQFVYLFYCPVEISHGPGNWGPFPRKISLPLLMLINTNILLNCLHWWKLMQISC